MDAMKAPTEQPFWSNVRGDQQRLANGNTLITESEGGRLLRGHSGRRDRLGIRQPDQGNDDGSLVSILG